MTRTKEQIHGAMRRAAEDRVLKDVSQDTGIEITSLYAFSSKGYINSKSRDKIEAWLERHGYFQRLIEEHSDGSGDLLPFLADRLIAVANVVRNEKLSRSYRMAELQAFARVLKEGLSELDGDTRNGTT